MIDRELSKWSGILLALAYITAFMAFAAPLGLLFDDSPLALAKGSEIWSTTLQQLRFADASFCVVVLLLPNLAWVYCVIQIIRLAKRFRNGDIFAKYNSLYFIRIGRGLAVMGGLSMIVLPAIAYFLFARDVAPWLADMPLWGLVEPDLFMAGAFFYVLGKIMRRGASLEELAELTV